MIGSNSKFCLITAHIFTIVLLMSEIRSKCANGPKAWIGKSEHENSRVGDVIAPGIHLQDDQLYFLDLLFFVVDAADLISYFSFGNLRVLISVPYINTWGLKVVRGSVSCVRRLDLQGACKSGTLFQGNATVVNEQQRATTLHRNCIVSIVCFVALTPS